MDKMFELINALNALTKAVGVLTEKITTEYLNTFEVLYDPEKDEPQAAEVKELIAKYGASKLSDIAESDYAAVLAEAEGL